MSGESAGATTFTTPIALDRDAFMRRLIASLGHLNEAILGSDVAGAYIMNVGLSMGAAIEAEYKRFWGIDRPLTLDEYAHVIVDLKRKIQGNFSLVSKSPEKVVVRTTSCPFDAFVRESPSLCFMTSSVFGGIAARNFGWAKVVLHQRIALGDPGCYVSVYLQRTPEALAAVGREYAPDVDQASPDIAEQLRLMDRVHRLRRELIETTSRWEELVRGAAEAVAVVGTDDRVSFANARWRDLIGVEGGELVGGSLGRIVHPEDQGRAADAVARALQGERILGVEWRLHHRDGRWRTALASLGPIRDEAGHIVGAVAIVRDVTAEREAQRLKDEFVSTASHELRTPVATIKALSELLLRALDRGAPLPPDQLASRLELIRREADRLTLLATDLLDATRLQAGRFTLAPRPHDLREIVEASAARQRDLLLEGQDLRIVTRCPAEPVVVAVDRVRLEQVLANLLDNAVKYSPSGGTIEVDLAVAGDRARIAVRDQGIGIPAAEVERLFSPFYRASNASTRHFGGLGFGLYVSLALVEAHGGTIDVESAEGAGSTFTVSLPLASSPRV